jgi:ABC-type nitrate/sulfonate/bicarbonate transport system permease component
LERAAVVAELGHQAVSRFSSSSEKALLRVAGVVGVVGLWSLLTASFPEARYLLATPTEWWGALWTSIPDDSLWIDIRATLLRASIAFVLGAAVGVPLGVLIGRLERVADALEIPVDFVRSIPVSALFPAFVLWLGLGSRSQIAAAAFGCAMMFLINVIYGVRNRSRKREDYLLSLGATRYQIVKKVLFWEITSALLSSSRISLSNALVLIVVTEMLAGGSGGLGQRIQDCRLSYRIPEMWVAIFIIGLIGLGLNRLLMTLESRNVHWQGR